MPYTISPRITLTQVGTSDRFVLQLDNRVMYVGRLLYVIIRELMCNRAVRQITETINAERILSRPLTEDEVATIIRDKVVPLNLTETSGVEVKDLQKDIRLRVVLLRFPQIVRLLDILRHLFRPATFWPLFVLSSVSSLYFLLSHWHTATNAPPTGLAWLAFLCAMFVVILCHELGHAAAAWQNRIEPKEIGVGMYLCFPVFYADVTQVWKLPEPARIIVNLAGAQIQLLLNLLIFASAAVLDDGVWRSSMLQLALINSFSVVANLNPFMKFDGYWVVADMLRQPNLNKASNAWLRGLMCGRPARERATLVAYSLLRLGFIACMLTVVVNVVPGFVQGSLRFAEAAWVAGAVDPALYREAGQRTIGMALLSYSVVRLAKSIGKSVFAAVAARKKKYGGA